MAKEVKPFSERSKPVQVLQIMGGICVAIILLAIVNAPDNPTNLTDPHLKLLEERQFRADLACALALTKSVQVNKDSVKIAMTGNAPIPVDEVGLHWKYNNIVRSKNAFNSTVEKPFECHIYFPTKNGTVTYLKVGNNIVIGQ